jgi:lipopolysaccharide assembly outer membrane protein LptD (OstA)
VAEFNGLSFALGNKLFRRGEGSSLIGDFILSALYDFDALEFGNIYLDGRLFPLEGASLRFNLGFNPRDAEVSEGLLRASYQDRRGDSFYLGYRFIRDVPALFEAFPEENRRFEDLKGEFSQVHQISGGFRIAITRNWGVLYRVAYSFERNALLGNAGGIEYISGCQCWALRVEVQQRRNRGVGVALRFAFTGLGDDSRSPFQSSGRSGDMGWGGSTSF